MKSLKYIMLVLGFSLIGCHSQKVLADNTPFETGTVSCQAWHGGRFGSGSGMNLYVPIIGPIPENVTLKRAYFRDRVADIEVQTKNGQIMAKANFVDTSSEKQDVIMHAEPQKEVGNAPPKRNEKMPFELKTDECVLSYEESGTLKFMKIMGVKEKKALTYQ